LKIFPKDLTEGFFCSKSFGADAKRRTVSIMPCLDVHVFQALKMPLVAAESTPFDGRATKAKFRFGSATRAFFKHFTAFLIDRRQSRFEFHERLPPPPSFPCPLLAFRLLDSSIPDEKRQELC
jgi:hypothetical protein